ncbi:ATP-binding protein [Microaerobacter geothermalis]|uniref:sensor histidine kinase n=1 Tax=Microaerobacter geothermalis TaxID=674972 RepID=UPI001F316AA3|nr:ATP-binding protein [Microaerobacter geothermalis]MCF6095068.1 ATP-binding protein [Microaerobacter geothermalis]
MKKKSIERKIMFPFLLLVLFPSLVIGAVSYWTVYTVYRNINFDYAEKQLYSAASFLEWLRSEGEIKRWSPEQQREIALSYLAQHPSIIVREIESGQSSKEVSRYRQKDGGWWRERWLMLLDVEGWDWQLAYPLSFSYFTEPLMDIQKNTMLVVLITSLVAVEITIILAHHLSKPLKQLAQFCQGISEGINKMTHDLPNKRKDEIGILSDSLKKMVNKLEEKNYRLLAMTQLNDTILKSTHLGIVTLHNEEKETLNPAAMHMVEQHPALLERIRQLRDRSSQEINGRMEETWVMEGEQGTSFYAVSRSPMRGENDQANGLLFTLEDITQRKRIEEKLERMDRLASLGELAAGLAHEIRNPLAGIKTTSQILRKRLFLTQENKDLFEGIIVEIDRLNQIITNLLRLAQPVKTEPRLVKINQVVQSTTSLLRKICEEQRVRLVLNINPKAEVWIDPDHFRQILLNLCLNAIKAMPHGGLLIIRGDCRETDSYSEVVVEDTGVGMDDNTLKKIFNPFFTTFADGTGLGLSIVHQLAVQNRGEVEVRSQLGKGTCFTLKFPPTEEGRFWTKEF